MFPDDIDKYLEEGKDTAVIGIGSCEQHGPHLLLGCDFFIATGLAQAIAKASGACLFPTIPYSWVGGLRVWPGAINIRSKNAGKYLEEVCMNIQNMGFKRLLLVCCHGGAKASVNSIAMKVFKKTGIPVLSVYISDIYSRFAELQNVWDKYGIGERDWLAYEASYMMSGLMRMGKSELVKKVERLIKEGVEEFGEEETPVEPRRILNRLHVGHDYIEETNHVVPKSCSSVEAGMEAHEKMGELIAKIIDKYYDYNKNIISPNLISEGDDIL